MGNESMTATLANTPQQALLEYYTPYILSNGPSEPGAVAWNSRDSQESRFHILAQVGCLRGGTILDVGCGLGDFSSYLTRTGAGHKSYLGIDINPKMIELGSAKHPDASFELRDLNENPFDPDSFDFVFESGIFNVRIPDWEEFTFGTIRRMYQACRKALAINFVSRLSGNSNPDIHYSLPSEILGFVERDLSHRFVLRHDYRTNDFTVFVYKEPMS